MNEYWLEKLIQARSWVLTLRGKYPDEILLLSALTQLDYLIALECGVEHDDSGLEKIDVGYLAMYPLVDILPHDLSVTLCDIAGKVKRELRLQGRQSNLP